MVAKSVLMRPGARAPTCYATDIKSWRKNA